MNTITVIMPDGSMQEHHAVGKVVEGATAAEVFAWIADHITMRGEMQIGEAVLIAKTEEGWRVHGSVDYKSLIDRLESVSKEEAGEGK